MIDGWMSRLVEAIDAHQRLTGEKDSPLSKRSGLGTNFISQLRSGRAAPKLDALQKLANNVNASLMAILFGKDLTKEEELFLMALRQMEDQMDRAAYLRILRGMTQREEFQAQPPAPLLIGVEKEPGPQ